MCSVRGRPGIGKSSIAIYVAKHVHDRRWYRSGVYYYPVERIVQETERRYVGSPQHKLDGSSWRDDSARVKEKARQFALTQFVDDISALLLSFPRCAL